MHRRAVAALGALVLAVGVTSLTDGAATARPATGSTSSSSGVLYQSCLDHAYSYRIDRAADVADWDASVDLIGPDGEEADSDFLSASDGDIGTASFLFCGSELAGRYTIRTSVEYYDADYNSTTEQLPDSTFTMRAPRTLTGLRVSDRTARRGQVIRIRIRARDERPAGYFATELATVFLQQRVHGQWRKVKGSLSYTNARGRVSLRVRKGPQKRTLVRAVTPATDYLSGSVSPVIRIVRVRH